MKLRNKIPTLPTVLAVVAIVIAGSGTAVAVSATTTISDPQVPSRIARVDQSGRLTTIGAASDINTNTYGIPNASGFTDVFVTSGTAATLGVTRLALQAPPTNSAPYLVTLYQVPVNPDGTCNTSIAWRSISAVRMAPGAYVEDTYPAPLTAAPRGTAKYCFDVYLQAEGGTSSLTDSVRIQFSAMTITGRYTGTGSGAAKAGTKDANGKTVVGS